MIYSNFGNFKDPLKQDFALQFCINPNKDFSILTETHISHDQIYHIRNIPFNGRVLCVYTPSGHNIMEQLARKIFFKGQQSYIKNKRERNENKIILGDFNCNVDKTDSNGEKNTKTLFMGFQLCHFKIYRG